MEPKKSTYWKFVIWFLLIIVLAFALLIGWNYFDFKRGERAVQDLAEGLERMNKELYDMQLADTYGGKTPQETLSLYIEAVEKGDYELASKYFVIEKREEELVTLQNISEENLMNILNLLKISVSSEGSFSAEKDGYTIRKPLLVDFVLYPSGVWKILEI